MRLLLARWILQSILIWTMYALLVRVCLFIDLPDLNQVYLAGEPIPQRTADKWAVDRELYNAYGPTEVRTILLSSQLTII